MADDPDSPPVLDYVRAGRGLSRGTLSRPWEAFKLSLLVAIGLALLLPVVGVLVALMTGLARGSDSHGTIYFCCALPAVVGLICLQYGVRGLNQLFRPDRRSTD